MARNEGRFLLKVCEWNNYIQTVGILEDELNDILPERDEREKFQYLFVQRLRYLREKRDKCYLRGDWFKRLKHDKNQTLYSMRFKSGKIKKNVRILFVLTNRNAVLLCAFIENNKKAYDKYAEIAHTRLDYLEETEQIRKEMILCHNA